MEGKMEFENTIEMRVLLLALYKKKENESFGDILTMLQEGRVFERKLGRSYLTKLKELSYIDGENLTFLGVEQAKRVELEFKI